MFDSATNQGNGIITTTSNGFNCSSVLRFIGVCLASCQWPSDPSTLSVFPGSFGAVAVGSKITLRANVVKAQCSSNDQAACAGWKFMNEADTRVLKPANPFPPTITLAIPTTIGTYY